MLEPEACPLEKRILELSRKLQHEKERIMHSANNTTLTDAYKETKISLEKAKADYKEQFGRDYIQPLSLHRNGMYSRSRTSSESSQRTLSNDSKISL